MLFKIIENIIDGYILFKFVCNIIYYLNKMIFLLGCFYITYKLFNNIFEFNNYIKCKYIGKERTETYILIFSTLFGIAVGIYR